MLKVIPIKLYLILTIRHIIVAETFPRNNAVEITKVMDFADKTLIPLNFDNEIELLSNNKQAEFDNQRG